MVLQDAVREDAEQQVLAIVIDEGRSYSPVDVIRELRERGVSESMARAAIWFLIDRYQIDLTWDRQLRRVPVEAEPAR